MEKYIDTKTIEAEPMTRGDYNKYRGWAIPADENPDDEGYLVKYSDGLLVNNNLKTNIFRGRLKSSLKKRIKYQEK